MTAGNREKGFTLIEVLIAMTLLVIGILAVASMQITSLGGNSLAMRITEASIWSGDRMEILMALPYDHADLADDNGDGFAGLDYTDEAGKPADGTVPPLLPYDGASASASYTVFWNVAENYPINNCKTIRVIVRRGDKGIMKTVFLDFIKMRSL
jgi:prepilin-type N-terminal cleavage/methylation domain-containing protein